MKASIIVISLGIAFVGCKAIKKISKGPWAISSTATTAQKKTVYKSLKDPVYVHDISFSSSFRSNMTEAIEVGNVRVLNKLETNTSNSFEVDPSSNTSNTILLGDERTIKPLGTNTINIIQYLDGNGKVRDEFLKLEGHEYHSLSDLLTFYVNLDSLSMATKKSIEYSEIFSQLITLKNVDSDYYSISGEITFYYSPRSCSKCTAYVQMDWTFKSPIGVFETTIFSENSVGIGEKFVGVERITMAIEGAFKENIFQFISQLENYIQENRGSLE